MLEAKNIALVGFGREGQSSLKFTQSLKGKRRVSVVDAQDGPDYLKRLKDYDLIVRSPGVPFKLVKKYAAPKAVITSQTKLFFELCPAKIIGVTGTKGKSTTASLIAAVLEQKFPTHLVGNIGQPALDSLAKITADSLVVFELSSHQLSDLTQSPAVAVLLNLYPEHLDYYADVAEYASAKARITQWQSPRDLLVYNLDDERIRQIAGESRARKISFSIAGNERADCYLKKDFIYYQAKPVFPVKVSPLFGRFNLVNLMPALIVGGYFGVESDTIVKAISRFRPLPHRLELAGKIKGITFINDSLSTVPQAAVKAIDACQDSLDCLIVGGYDRGVDQAPLVRAIIDRQIPLVIALPDTGKKIKALLTGEKRIKVSETSSMKAAVALAKKGTPRGKICLLSPGAASFNLFKDYQDRGNQFKLWVKRL